MENENQLILYSSGEIYDLQKLIGTYPKNCIFFSISENALCLLFIFCPIFSYW